MNSHEMPSPTTRLSGAFSFCRAKIQTDPLPLLSLMFTRFFAVPIASLMIGMCAVEANEARLTLLPQRWLP
jgi:hypothetical protein